MNDLRGLISSLEDTFRVSLQITADPNTNNSFGIRFHEFPSPFGLSVLIRQNPLTWEAKTILDSQAGEVVQALRLRWMKDPEDVQLLLENGRQVCERLELQVNGSRISQVDPSDEWVSAELIGKSSKDDGEPLPALEQFLSSFLGTTLDIFAEWHISDEIGEVEGGYTKAIYNRYERSSANRAVCLSVKGSVCVACGEDPGIKYKMDGKRVVHVHHLTPVSQMGGRRPVDPIKELVPLCPNCHNVAHKRNPPFTPGEIRNLIESEPKVNSQAIE